VAAPELEGFAKLVDGGIVDGGVAEDAIVDVLFEDEKAGRFETGADGEELGEDVLAAALVFEHVAEPAYLAFDAGEAV
jgi:hypothetical protein